MKNKILTLLILLSFISCETKDNVDLVESNSFYQKIYNSKDTININNYRTTLSCFGCYYHYFCGTLYQIGSTYYFALEGRDTASRISAEDAALINCDPIQQ